MFGSSSYVCQAQDTTDADVTDITTVTFFNPGIGYELTVGKKQTLVWQAGLGFSGALGYSASMGFLSEWEWDPYLLMEYRYYFGWNRRMRLGKSVAMNSANYLSPFFRTAFPRRLYLDGEVLKEMRKPVHGLGLTVGMQRNFRSRFSLDLNIGFGHTIEPAYRDWNGTKIRNSQFYFPGRLSLGFWLNSRSKYKN